MKSYYWLLVTLVNTFSRMLYLLLGGPQDPQFHSESEESFEKTNISKRQSFSVSTNRALMANYSNAYQVNYGLFKI